MKKLFIVLEGIDGSGTSTQANLLKNYFLTRGEKAVISPEPTKGRIGKLIREALQNPLILGQTSEKFDQQIAYLFAADRHYHLYNQVDGIFKLIEQDHCHVITTRYYFSSLAYNCQTPEEFNFVSQLNQKFSDPDLVIYLELPVDISLERLTERSQREIYEQQEKLTQVKRNFSRIFANYKKCYLSLDAREKPDIISSKITQFIEEKFAEET